MCRWFAYLSPTEPCLLEDVLISPKHSLVNQVNDHYLPYLIEHAPGAVTEDHTIKARNCLFNVDGVGVAWYTSANADFEKGNTGESADGTKKEGLRPAVYKNVTPPLNDRNFRSICANTETNVCFGHIRAALGTPTTLFSNHPFVFGRHILMHNGLISDFTEIKRHFLPLLSDASFANIEGSTDTEHFAALYMTHLTSGGDAASFENDYPLDAMVAALQATVSDIVELQLKVLGSNAKPNSLNICATDGIKLVACRFRNHAIEQPPSLYYSTKAGVTLNRKYPDNADGVAEPGRVAPKAPEEHGLHMIVASEPSTYVEKDWHLIGKNQYVTASTDGVVMRDMAYKPQWNVNDPHPLA